MAWAPAYVTTAQLRSFLNINDTEDDAELDFAIESASRAVDLDTNRQFGSVSAAQRFYTGHYDKVRRRWIVEIDDLMSSVGFAAETQDANGTTVGAINDYVLEPRNAAAKGRPWTEMMIRPNSTYKPTGAIDEVAITAPWGWTSVPNTVVNATMLQASRFFARRTSPYGIAGSPDLGSELRLLARVDPDVSVMLRSYRRWWAGA